MVQKGAIQMEMVNMTSFSLVNPQVTFDASNNLVVNLVNTQAIATTLYLKTSIPYIAAVPGTPASYMYVYRRMLLSLYDSTCSTQGYTPPASF